ncbi:pyruvate kinase [Neptuniibacter halophilus]|uniref:pyruvate kinase n=1 Tax=Neptuniibacter halophilus TaxID=651666 RepID=UPI002572781B|nr:pyruvate kinase [Neptuniibacter halophilus]
MQARRTKIVATLGPATDDPAALEQLLLAGVNVVRLNFSHGSVKEHRQRAEQVRTLAEKHQLNIAILGDLQGPKIRIARFKEGKVRLETGQDFTLDSQRAKDSGDSEAVAVDYPDLIRDCACSDILLLDDGRIQMEVIDTSASALHCRVLNGGVLSDNKGINKLGGGLSAPALTEKDKQDIETAVALDLDYLAVSFPRSEEDLLIARKLIDQAGGRCELVAKIERAEVVRDDAVLDAIILASDAIMVARGDLGVEIGDAALIGSQKKIIRRAVELNRVVITATQMMESMIDNPMPTRAEVFDVANAVLDGTDAVMLSAETAAGKHPVATVQAMACIIAGAEEDISTRTSHHRLNLAFTDIDETIAMATMYAANHSTGIKAVICMTETGKTTRLLSRINSGLPILALTRHPRTARRAALYRGVETVQFDTEHIPNAEINQRAVDELKRQGIVTNGDRVLITKGDYINAQGGTNTLKIVTVGQPIH